MEVLRKASGLDDLQLIHELAHRIWWPTYQDYLDPLQIETMLDDMYSVSSLRRQQVAGITFVLWCPEGIPSGFIGYGPSKDAQVMRIEKIYILPEAQGQGGGSMLLEHVAEEAIQQRIPVLELNVNRYNPAQHFYTRQGFHLVKEMDIPYGSFVLNDYVMAKKLF